MPRLSKPPGIPILIAKPTASSSTTSSNGASEATIAKLTRPPLSKNSTRPSTRHSRDPRASQASRVSQTLQSPQDTNAEPSFICTICWQSQVPPSKPKLLGSSSRIVCRPCWKAVLDLSICWVCGECIVRGDEVVSLGWCFWHRACFGCLTCGTRMDLVDFEEGNGGEWGTWGADAGKGDGVSRDGKRKRMIGVELEKVPLCETCEIETAGAPYGEVVEKGLETVSRFDGGLSRDRLDMLSEEKEETKRVGRSRWKRSRFRGSSGLERELKRFINGSTSRWSEFVAADDLEAQKALIKHAADMGISEDGIADEEEEHSHSDNERIGFGQTDRQSPPAVYVSVLNPLGEPAFKPSKTKPLPLWMSLLPNNVHREREQRKRTIVSDPCPYAHEMERLDGGSMPIDVCYALENNDKESSSANGTTPRTPSRTSTMPVAEPTDVLATSIIPRKSRITVSIDPKREHTYGTLGYGVHQEPKSYESGYIKYAPRPPAQQTPYPGRHRPSMTRRETASYVSHGLPKDRISEFDEESCYGLRVDLKIPASSPDSSSEGEPSRNSSIGYFSLPSSGRLSPLVVQSSEYLERYQPKAAGTTYQKYVAKDPEPIIEKIKRQRIGRQSQGEIAEEAVETRSNSNKRIKFGNEEYGLDPTSEGLKKELRNLFCEE